ncbi:hypothetical protein KY284_020159 [Solanum tuberosum]|nr:hypothetical protein KY284_020159 [Solanum tuberosum]
MGIHVYVKKIGHCVLAPRRGVRPKNWIGNSNFRQRTSCKALIAEGYPYSSSTVKYFTSKKRAMSLVMLARRAPSNSMSPSMRFDFTFAILGVCKYGLLWVEVVSDIVMPHRFDELGNHLSMLLCGVVCAHHPYFYHYFAFLRAELWDILHVAMSSSQRPGKEVATSSSRKCVRSGNVPTEPVLPRGQTRRFGVKAVTKEGKAWYKKHTETTYFFDVCIDGDSLAREFPQIRC